MSHACGPVCLLPTPGQSGEAHSKSQEKGGRLLISARVSGSGL